MKERGQVGNFSGTAPGEGAPRQYTRSFAIGKFGSRATRGTKRRDVSGFLSVPSPCARALERWSASAATSGSLHLMWPTRSFGTPAS
jgi:hypothetical protein